MVSKTHWKNLTRFISNGEHFLLTTHINPDGDGLGSQIAMAEYLKQCGKNVTLINNNQTPVYFSFLDPENQIQIYNQELDEIIKSVDGVIIVDISDWERLGKLGQVIKTNNIPVACIDHHIPTDTMGETQILDQTVSSTGELVYQYLADQNADFGDRILSALYTTILTDTGSFRFSNTTPQTHRIAADLIERGADFKMIFKNIYESHSKNRVRLTGELLSNLQFACDDRLAWFVLSKELIERCGVENWELEGLSELPRHLKNLEISIMFTEIDKGTKVSLRSSGNIPINGLANLFGGGGHQFASGALLKMDKDKAIKTIIEEAKKLFN